MHEDYCCLVNNRHHNETLSLNIATRFNENNFQKLTDFILFVLDSSRLVIVVTKVQI